MDPSIPRPEVFICQRRDLHLQTMRRVTEVNGDILITRHPEMIMRLIFPKQELK